MSPELTPDQLSALVRHNHARAQVGSKPLQWSGELADRALIWAQHLAGVNIGFPRGRLRLCGHNEGENIVVFRPARNPRALDSPLTELTAQAYRERHSWHGGEIGKLCEDKCEHGQYTQMIWKDTTHVGMAAVPSANGKIYAVARYWPVGNIVGEAPIANGQDEVQGNV